MTLLKFRSLVFTSLVIGGIVASELTGADAPAPNLEALVVALQSDDAEARFKATAQMAQAGVQAVAPLAKCLGDERAPVAEAARSALTGVANRATRPDASDEKLQVAEALAKAYSATRKPVVKNGLLEILGLVAGEESVPVVAAALKDPATLDAACQALVRIPAPSAAQALREALENAENDDVSGQVAIINAMGQKQDAAAAEILAGLVEGKAPVEVRVAAAEALSKNSQAYAYTQVIWDALPSESSDATPHMRSRIWDSLLRAGQAFIDMGEVGAASDFFRDLQQIAKSRAEKCSVIVGLAKASRREAPGLIFEAIRQDDPVVRSTAIDGLGYMRWGMISPELPELLEELALPLKVEILTALAQREEPQVGPLVAPYLSHESPAVRKAALGVFEGQSTAEAAQPLIDVIVEGGAASKEGAVGILARMTGEEIQQAISDAAKEASPEARGRLLKALEKK